MAKSPPLPYPIESELVRLLDGPEDEFWPGVARVCQRHPERSQDIQREAERLLAAAEGKRPAGSTEAKPGARGDDAELRPGDRVGPFVVLDAIGHGGMGSVYLAEQKEPVRRRVALKVIKLGMDTKAVLARFEAERQALAMMDHSHIAKVLEAGITPSGRPYFAMEYVKGVPITRYCDEQKLSLEDRLALFKQVCGGVQHAHQKGVIHRDLTPNNVLVTVQDGLPSAKIIDFGLARATDQRLTEKTLFTEQGVILGTPEYMSPEQAGLSALDIDMRSDVYTLGVLLYELLTGKLPFEGKALRAGGYDAMCKTIREAEPPRPSTQVTTHQGGTAAAAKLRRTDASTLLKRLRGDLDWIVLKCLEKDRTRRYETVAALADDVQRHLDSEPVLARAPSVGYRMAKFARRYRVQVAAAAVVLVAVVGALVVALVFWREARDQATEAKRQEGIAQMEAQAAQAARAGEAARAREAEANAATAQRNAEEAIARKREFDQLAGVVLYERAIETEKKLHPAWPGQVVAMERWLSEDAGRLLAMRGQIEQTVADLRARALEATAEDIERDRTSHGKFDAWQKQAAKLGSLTRAQAIRTNQELTLPLPTAEEQAMTPDQLNELAWPRVDFDESKRIWGEEARGLMLAKLAWEGSASLPAAKRASFGDTLAWAWFANGKDSEAIAQSEASLALVGDDEKATYAGHLASLQAKVAAASGETGAKALAELGASVTALEADVNSRRTYRFGDESQSFLHDTLSDLLAKLASLDGKERKAVEERLAWAKRVTALTLGHPKARATWQQAREAIAKADGVVASGLYRGQRIELRDEDVLGLVPIGMNPVTKLWEFYELRSAWDGLSDPASIEIPQHIEAGQRADHIEVGDGTGIVFVLLPGGRFTMGSQDQDPSTPNYDAQRDHDEVLHEVELSPFLMARHELTQGQWKRLSGGLAPSYYSPNSPYFAGRRFDGGLRFTWSHPVEQVAWQEAHAMLARHGMILPTEAQWEFGCRSGNATPRTCSIYELPRHANLADATRKQAGATGRCEEWDDGHIQHAPVGTFLPNGYGLFDTLGNVWEWTMDGEAGSGAVPRSGDGFRGAPDSVTHRVARGAGFSSTARYARSAYRYRATTATLDGALGVRASRRLNLGFDPSKHR